MKVLHLLASGGTGGIEVLCKNIAFYSDSNVDNRFVVLFNDGEISKEMKGKGINVFSVSNLSFFTKINKIAEYCEKEKIDIIVNHHGGLNCNILYCLLKYKFSNIKYIRYMHACFDGHSFGCGKNKIKDFFIKKMMQKAINISDCLIYISEASKKSFEKNFNIEKQKNFIIYNGIGNDFFDKPIMKKSSNKDKINLIYVGRLIKLKGVDVLIDAFSKIRKEEIEKEYFLTIVGDGIEKKNLERKSEELGISKYINFVGKQKDVIKWLDKSDIFIYPSIWEEGFGISVVEAMARGCIPITFNKGGLPEIIKNKFNGFLVEKVDSDLLSKVIKNVEITEELKENAIKTAEKFTIKYCVKNLEEVYYKI